MLDLNIFEIEYYGIDVDSNCTSLENTILVHTIPVKICCQEYP